METLVDGEKVLERPGTEKIEHSEQWLKPRGAAGFLNIRPNCGCVPFGHPDIILSHVYTAVPTTESKSKSACAQLAQQSFRNLVALT